MRSGIALVIFLITIHSSFVYAQDEAGLLYETEQMLASHDASPVLERLEQRNDTLYDALALAYENNPQLKAARKEYLVVEEQLPQAQAGLKPRVTIDADVTHTHTETEGTSFITSDGGNLSKSASLNISQPLFNGGSTVANIKSARNTITAQSLRLSQTEQAVLYETVVAYMDLLQSKAIVDLNESNKKLAMRELERSESGFTVGELTRTDISQAEARLAEANAGVISAVSDYESAVAVYQQRVGADPFDNLAYPEKVFELPPTLEECLALADSNNRQVLIAKFVNRAAEEDVDSVSGEFLPQISAGGSLNKSYDPNDFLDEQQQLTAGINASIPLYEAGATRSRLRQAKKTANQRYLEILNAQNMTRQEVISLWNSLRAAEAEIKARQTQVEAARIAREGVHYETELGERTILDTLDSNQELLDAQVNLVIAKRNEVVGRFALARSLGLLVPQKLGFNTINPENP